MSLKAVQAAITSIGFPDSLDGVRDMVEKHGSWTTDMAALLEAGTCGEGGNWTAPKWMTPGDILFFYHTKNARPKIHRLLDQVNESLATTSRFRRIRGRDLENMRGLLQHSARTAALYSGTIFGSAEISGATGYYEGYPGATPHFKGRLFAPIKNTSIFDAPLPTEEFADLLRMGQGAITPLHGEQFNKMRERLGKRNELPGFLTTASIGGPSFKDVTQDNWATISCVEDVGFLDEAQVREYLLDFLLKELKDKGTPLLEECRCYSEGQVGQAKIADYFVSIHGRWIPVEAKLNILAERNVLGQVAPYVAADYFIPSRKPRMGQKFWANNSRLCIIADQSGLYLVSDGRFSGCVPGAPVWRRRDLGHATIGAIRKWIEEELFPSGPSAENVGKNTSLDASFRRFVWTDGDAETVYDPYAQEHHKLDPS
jgi:hypothetical protein